MPNKQHSSSNVLIIGAGPAGLAVAARLTKAGIDYHLVEQSAQIANRWKRHYDRLHLHTVKAHSGLPYLPFPDHYPKYIPKDDLVAYYESYAKTFGIQPRFECGVSLIERNGNGWRVKFTTGEEATYQFVVVATGVNNAPFCPKIQGEEQFAGEILHSITYQNPKPFLGKKVLVVGMGNTGAEIALDLAEAGIDTAISVRGTVNIVPRDILGRSTQETALSLSKLPNWLNDSLGVLVRTLFIGNVSKYGLKLSDMPPSKQLRVTGKTPVIDLGTLNAIKAGRIKVKPSIEYVEIDQVVFSDQSSSSYDTILLATGYLPALAKFIPEISTQLASDGTPRQVIGTNLAEGLYFIGFDNFKPSGILGAIVVESAAILAHLQQQFQ